MELEYKNKQNVFELRYLYFIKSVRIHDMGRTSSKGEQSGRENNTTNPRVLDNDSRHGSHVKSLRKVNTMH